jgi:hypothetical protein
MSDATQKFIADMAIELEKYLAEIAYGQLNSAASKAKILPRKARPDLRLVYSRDNQK